MAKGTHCLGVDIGSSSVKICELDSRQDDLHLQNFDYTTLPNEAIVDGELMNATAVGDAISTLLDRNDVRRQETALSVSGNTVIIKKITLPLMTQEELEESIQWEAEQFIPFEIEDVYVGFEVLAPRTEQGQMDVVLVAAKKELINDYVEVCRQNDLEPLVVDVDPFAVQNMYEVNYGFQGQETVNLLDMGNSVISINIVRDGITSFTRDLSLGGANITEEISRRLNITYDEAEIYKMGGNPDKERGRSLREDSVVPDTAGAGDAVVPQEVEDIIQEQADEIADQLEESLDFFAATAADSHIDQNIVTGGTGAIPSLRRIIASKTGVDTELANPFRSIQYDERDFPPERIHELKPIAGVAVGLALRRTDES